MSSSALETSLVLSEIFSYLPLSDLSSTRLVNHLWLEESQKYFIKRGMISVCFNSILNVEEYLDSCKEHKNITIDTIKEFPNIYQKQKFLNLVAHHFTNSQINCLKLSVDLSKILEYELVTQIIKNLPHLKELSLVLRISNWNEIEETWLSDISPLLLLKSFTLDVSYVNLHLLQSREPKRQELSRKLIQITPNINHLSICGSDTEFFKIYLQEIINVQEVDSTSIPFNNLNSLHFDTGEVKMLELCLNLLQPIKQLKISSNFEIRNNNGWQHLVEVLTKNSKTLKNLSIFQYLYHNTPPNRPVQLPKLPALESLLLDYSAEVDMLAFQDPFRINNELKVGSELFKDKFPKLKSLELNLKLRKGTTTLNYFIPFPNRNVDLRFKQITSFKLCLPYGEESRRQRQFIRLSNMFPNVHQIIFYYPIN